MHKHLKIRFSTKLIEGRFMNPRRQTPRKALSFKEILPNWALLLNTETRDEKISRLKSDHPQVVDWLGILAKRVNPGQFSFATGPGAFATWLDFCYRRIEPSAELAQSWISKEDVFKAVYPMEDIAIISS